MQPYPSSARFLLSLSLFNFLIHLINYVKRPIHNDEERERKAVGLSKRSRRSLASKQEEEKVRYCVLLC